MSDKRERKRYPPPPSVLVCPICGKATNVRETRTTVNGLRRRRVCVNRACPGRLTTYEIVAVDAKAAAGKRSGFVVVPARELDALLELAMRLGGIES